MQRIKVKASTNYEVVIGKDLLNKIGVEIRKIAEPCKVGIITDNKVAGKYLETVKNSLEKEGFTTYNFVFKNGEKSKTVETFIKIQNFLAENEFSRKDILLALGGGVVGDLTGFCASTYMRGIRYVQAPTTLLAGIDSSVGGKTAIDLKAGKNLVGTFYQPIKVVFDIKTLDSLPEKEYLNGLGEGVKYAIMDGGEIYELVKDGLSHANLEKFCALCVKSKKAVVEKDEKEGGYRKILNLGHTFAHAIEKLSDYTIPHGRCVAMGLKIIADVSLKQGWLSTAESILVEKLLKNNGLMTPSPFEKKDMIEVMRRDKKVSGDKITIVSIAKIGKCEFKEIKLDQLKKYLR
ncbi:MAG: 3-dehydroquinate synthase [Clostridia bacterium]|nr:3-dehydroquinate synthase [Clostridia bacterium]